MDYIVYAIPVFLVLIAIEVIATRVRKKEYYQFSDAINSLSAGMISITSGIITKVVGVTIYSGIYGLTAWFELSESLLWVWLTGFIIYDLCYYWTHRMGHEINVLWAAHAVHHQSEEYNLTTALRQTSTGFLFGWLFYVPMAIGGIPPVVFFTVGLINLLYQFWVHTRHISTLGWVEWVFVTPSNHRVHHAKNRRYLDKNYGGVFIVWDRLFGTFEPEDKHYEPIRYGTLKPLRSWNPVWANLHIYSDLFKDSLATRRWKDKLTLWFRKTGYRPADVATPMTMPDIHAYENYQPAISRGVQWYSGLHFALLTIGTTGLMGSYHLMPFGFNLLWACVLALQLTMLGRLLEKPQHWVGLETVRFTTAGMALLLTTDLYVDFLPGQLVLFWAGFLVLALVSCMAFTLVHKHL